MLSAAFAPIEIWQDLCKCGASRGDFESYSCLLVSLPRLDGFLSILMRNQDFHFNNNKLRCHEKINQFQALIEVVSRYWASSEGPKHIARGMEVD